MPEKEFSPIQKGLKQEHQEIVPPKGLRRPDITKTQPYQRLKSTLQNLDKGLTRLETAAIRNVEAKLQKEAEDFEKKHEQP